jgi:integrase
MASTPRKADYAWTTLARLLAIAKDRGRISINPCERGGRLYSGDRADRIWTETDIGRLLATANPEMELALMLALWTGQRQGDLIALTWSAYDGSRIRLRQSKTGQSIVVPVGSPLKTLLDTATKRSTSILTDTRGRPWTSDGFRTSWGKLCARAGVLNLTFHDLRGSAVTRLALAGASVPEIAGVTGHSLKDVETIVDRHYLGGRAVLAETAIRRLERKERRTQAVNQGVNRPADRGLKER